MASYLVRPANVLEGHTLVFIEKENAEFSGVYDFPDLVFPEVRVQSGLFIQPVRLVGNQYVDGVRFAVEKRPGPFEHVVDVGFSEMSFEFRLEDFPWGRVFAYVLGHMLEGSE